MQKTSWTIQFLIFLFSLIGIAVNSPPVLAVSKVETTVTISKPETHVFHVKTVIRDIQQPVLELGLPVWTPGHYVIEDYARNLLRVTVTDQAGRKAAYRKFTASSWAINTSNVNEVSVEFDYLADQIQLHTAFLTPTYGLLNPSNFVFYVKGQQSTIPHSLRLILPATWNIACGLAVKDGQVEAANFDELIDAPALVGEFDRIELPVKGIPHEFVYAPKSSLRPELAQELAQRCARIYESVGNIFGEFPFPKYCTINLFVTNPELVRGALEHNNSYVSLELKPEDSLAGLFETLRLASHEYFHAYNVKRIRPAELWPYRYDDRVFTPLLWVSEGFTRYYETRGLLLAGLVTPDEFLQLLANLIIRTVSEEPGKYISVEEASINTWMGGAGGFSQPFAVDYYARGAVIGLLLDLKIRQETQGQSSLDDVMRWLYTERYKRNQGFTTTDLISCIGRTLGKSPQTFFDRHVSGTDPLPIRGILEQSGLRLEQQERQIPFLGAYPDASNRVTAIIEDSIAGKAGVKEGDLLLGLGDVALDAPTWVTDFQKMYQGQDGKPFPIYAIRDGKPLVLKAVVKTIRTAEWRLVTFETTDRQDFGVRDRWLNGKTRG